MILTVTRVGAGTHKLISCIHLLVLQANVNTRSLSDPLPLPQPPTLRCTSAHRMQTPRGHASVARVLAAAGVHLPPSHTSLDATTAATKKTARDKDAQKLVRAVSGSGYRFGRGRLSRAASTLVLGGACGGVGCPRALHFGFGRSHTRTLS
jgi:hypothetical protein